MRIIDKLFKREERNMTLRDRQGWENILGPSTKSGVNVTPARAMSIPAALSAIRLLSESVASLPLCIYRRDRQGGRERAADHPLYRLLHFSPNDRQTAFQLKEMLMLGLLTQGNGYALIDWAENGQPSALWPINPTRVSVEQDPSTGQVVYKVTTGAGQIALPPAEILHVPGLCFDGLRGTSIISASREALGAAISELEHGSSYFKNAAMPSGVLTHPGKLKEDSFENLRRVWNQNYSGSTKAHRTAILEEGMAFEPISLNNRDSQWLESRAFSVKEIARIFRVPPHLLGDLEKASYSSIEAQNLEYLTYSLRPWLSRIEEAVNLKLLTPKEQKNLYSEFLTNDLLRTDTKNRFEAYRTALQAGWLNVNEVRKLENLPPVEGGDTHLFQLNQAPLEQVKQKDQERTEPVETEKRSASRDTNKEKIEAVVRDLLRQEHTDIMAQIGDDISEGHIKEVLQQYYEDRPESVKAKIRPLYSQIVDAVHKEASKKAGASTWTSEELESYTEGYVDTFARQHVAIGLTMGLTAASQPEPVEVLAETFETAIDTRPGKAAELESTALKSKPAVDTYDRAGIQKIMWKAEPDACAFCSDLDGKVVTIGEPFVHEGEALAPPPSTIHKDGTKAYGKLTARYPRISPPIHLGCQCSLEPVNI